MATHASATLYNLRVAPRKVRLVADAVRGRSVASALSELSFLPKRAAEPLRKLIASAAANAEHNFKLKREDLVIEQIQVGEGVTLKRFTPKAFGRAAPLRRRASHITVTVGTTEVKRPRKKATARRVKASA